MSDLRVLKSGHTVEPVSEEDTKRIVKDFPTFDTFVRFNPGGWFYMSSYADHLDLMYNFDFKPSDIFVITTPKSGTTWTQEIVWNLVHNPNLDNPVANTAIDTRSIHVEADALLAPAKMPKLDTISQMEQIIKKVAPHRHIDPKFIVTTFLEEAVESPRIIKTHYPLQLLSPKMLETSKVVYVVRDPRDVIVSKFHFFTSLKVYNYQGTLDALVDYTLNDEVFNHPYWLHVKAAFDLKDHPNLLFLYFEDMKADPLKSIALISQFLNLNRTPEQIENVANHTNFRNMKARTESGKQVKPLSDGGKLYTDINTVMRVGKSGSWKDSFSAEQVDKINNWVKVNLKDFPSDFKYKTTM